MTESLDMAMIQRILEGEREKLRQQLQILSGNGHTESKNPDQMDIAQAYSDQERSRALQTFEQKHLNQVEAALQAIADGSYGRCQHCQQPIPLERLQALPTAMMCVACQAHHS